MARGLLCLVIAGVLLAAGCGRAQSTAPDPVSGRYEQALDVQVERRKRSADGAGDALARLADRRASAAETVTRLRRARDDVRAAKAQLAEAAVPPSARSVADALDIRIDLLAAVLERTAGELRSQTDGGTVRLGSLAVLSASGGVRGVAFALGRLLSALQEAG